METGLTGKLQVLLHFNAIYRSKPTDNFIACMQWFWFYKNFK